VHAVADEVERRGVVVVPGAVGRVALAFVVGDVERAHKWFLSA
jgi:hypothetical protein